MSYLGMATTPTPTTPPTSKAASSPLTISNIKRLEEFSSPASGRFHHNLPRASDAKVADAWTEDGSDSSSYCEDDDATSVFSAHAAGSASSATSFAPEDDAFAPFHVVSPETGEQIAVYSSLEQAARYSSARAEAERRRQEGWLRGVAAAPAPTMATEPLAGGGDFFVAEAENDEDDEDAYFSMG
ncbi:hypothetical protein BX600DRAFT_237063 [Xylariales sp. PMI_506]|nr:hypothetical protein BX600DRAFT_237063 [Xylariales sp. PMI_506]